MTEPTGALDPDGRPSRVTKVVRVAPFLLIALSALADAESTSGQQYDRYLVAAPALAASVWGAGTTLFVGLLAMVAEAARGLIHDGRVGRPAVSVMAVIFTVSLAAAYAARVRVRRERDLAEVRSVARTAQQVVLRPLPDRLGSVELALYYKAAAAQSQIGGDLYEAVRTPHGVRLILGDVQGKGLPAVETAAALLGSFREAAYDAETLAELAARLETSLQRYAERASTRDSAERFATAILMEIPEDRPEAFLLNCGHPPPLMLNPDGVRAVHPDVPLPPLNLSSLVASEYRTETVPFGPGDRVLLYTDGVSEARDQNGEFYPLAERLAGWTGESSAGLLDDLRNDLTKYSGGAAADDVAVLIAARHVPEGP
ncbi:serine phosphatase RsbU (regulator of sigma subunit) [Catenulispora sp. GP43]|uniref:PP2C family protein-serine/threonine phosphatase n=1 Tax=Catenulispora sp. GP43 TaxID=3156263 RepID=UPI00351821DF